MEPFTLIAQNFWVIAIIATSINFLAFKDKARKYVSQNSANTLNYEKLFEHCFFWFNIPWIIMGIGLITKGVPSIYSYFRPQDGNPFVLVWYISIFSLWAVGTYWLILKDGAKFLVNNEGILKGKITSPLLIKLLWLICIVWGVAAVIFLFNNDILFFLNK